MSVSRATNRALTRLYENAHPLRPEDIADTIWWVVSRPAHVNVSQVEVMPTTQSLASARVFKG